MLSMLSNLTSSVTGSVDKALLCVRKSAEAKKPGSKPGVGNIALRESLVKAKKGFILNFFNVLEEAKKADFHVMMVKYNPSRLRISGAAESKMATGAGGAAANLQVQSMMPASTTLQVELLFDDENHQDAFMWDKMTNLSVGAVVSDVSGAVRNLKKDSEGYSVRKEMEAMIGMVTQSETRQVVFYWGDMAFAGVITEVQARYTMFNPVGNPVRGVVTLTIHQGGIDANNKGEDAYWHDAFDTLCSLNDIQGKVTGAVGNLLNLK